MPLKETGQFLKYQATDNNDPFGPRVGKRVDGRLSCQGVADKPIRDIVCPDEPQGLLWVVECSGGGECGPLVS